MKFKTISKAAVLTVCIGTCFSAQAIGLVGIDLDGNKSTFEAYYDQTQNISWLADSGSYYSYATKTWGDAMAWAATLNVYGITGWRLPTSANPDASCSDQRGYFVGGFNCTGSEMGHLANVDGVTTTNSAGFRIVGSWYWSSTRFVTKDPEGAYVFRFDGKEQSGDWAEAAPRLGVLAPALNYAWAVHDGDLGALASVPEPSTWALLALGLGTIAGAARRKPL